MERRELLKTGAVLSLGGTGCATMLSQPGAVEAGSLGEFLSTIDGAREAIARTPLFESFRDPARPDIDALVQERAALTRKVFRSLTLAGSISELPHEQRKHPEVLRRVSDSMGEFDDAMFGMTKLLEALSPGDRAQVGKALREDPHLGMRIMGEVDREAASLGLSSGLRLRMRTASAQAAARLRLSPDLAISEYTSKFRKLEARHGARSEAERQVTATIGRELLWAAEEGGSLGAAAGGALVQAPDAGAVITCVETSDCPEKQVCAGYKEVREGEWTLGVCQPGPRVIKRSPVLLSVGAVALGVGAALALPSLGGGLTILVTIGAVIAASGLIVLLIGLGMLAAGR